MQKIKIKPLSHRAENRIREHGSVMELVKRGFFKGDVAVLVKSLKTDWMGWFTVYEAEFKMIYEI